MNEYNNTKLCEFLYLSTTRCNCRCKHCSPSLYTGKENEMSSKELIQRYEESGYLQNNTISLAGGEPFVKADIEEFILYLDKKKIPCIISTNGYFTEKIEKLLEQLEDCSTIKFSISIDGIGGVHDEIRGVKGVYERAIKSASLIKEKGFGVQINMVAQKANIKDIPKMKKMFAEMGIPLNVIPKFKVGDEPFEFDTEEIREVYPYIQHPREKKLLLSKGEYTITNNCHAGKNSWLLDSNGDVYACCGAYYGNHKKDYLIGNLRETPFDELFTSERAKQVYEEAVRNCAGCANARDVEREVTDFGYSTEYSIDDIRVFEDKITNECKMEEINCDNCNWNDLEKDDNGNYRWTKNKRGKVFVKVPEKFQKLSVKMLCIREYTENGEKARIRVKIGNCIVGERECCLGENQFEFLLDQVPLNAEQLVEVEIETNMQWIPKLVGMGEDDRKLGLAIREVSITE